MEKKRIYSIAFILVFLFIGATVIFSATNQKITHPASAPCKESTEECCKKEKSEGYGNSFDFESLPGKFFSSVLIN